MRTIQRGKICSINECDIQAKSRDMCAKHYRDWYESNRETFDFHPSVIDRFRESYVLKVVKPELGPCWEWTGGQAGNGYGRFTYAKHKRMLAHRWSYEHHIGTIPRGLVLDHLCFYPACVRPSHLEPVTRLVNTILRGRTNAPHLNANKTHCKRGHPFDLENTYHYVVNGRPIRICKTCHNNRRRKVKV